MWHSEAKRLGGLEVDHQLEFGRTLHWKVGGLFALKGCDPCSQQLAGADQSGQVRKR